MKNKHLLAILILAVLFCCKSENNKPIEDVTKPEIAQEKNALNLELNNGEKWITNVETHEGMKHIDSILKAFTTEDPKDGLTLGNALSKETSYIIKSCTMKGKAHD